MVVIEPVAKVGRQQHRLVAIAGEEALRHDFKFLPANGGKARGDDGHSNAGADRWSFETAVILGCVSNSHGDTGKTGDCGSLGWDDQSIGIEAYDPRWPSEFEKERKALEETVGDLATGGIHHVGSTAVPGLEAKPIIDILMGVEDLLGSRACFGDLRRLGYLYEPYRPEEMHWFCKPHPSHRTHHLHVVPTNSRRFCQELAFRDHLRSNPEARDAYAALKRRLAVEFENDREAYTSAKGSFIEAALRGPAG
jgi:GrpB-like predicted nucleotidyltransferase (UPF0157 family)